MRAGLMNNFSQARHTGVITLLLVGFTIAYPAIVYLNLESVRPQWFAIILLSVLALRLVFVGKIKSRTDSIATAFAGTFCVAIILFDSVVLLKFYPVMMNAGMGLMFLLSLKDQQTLIEKFARASGSTVPEQARDYLRALSMVWGVLLLGNGAVAAYTALFASLSTWALYNGIISYLLLAGFALMELSYRGYYKKRHSIVDE
ncbi:hypothetical protein CA267_009220 [Alteromonas pelagimontana]|uniref:DNA gyrase subunit B n=1 Tax=Alteromonas pelagimontana TaxID=1858656 RepID=A0A6M4MED9_9ALTE|nr:hypothetical protein [Alteromonas pelagimontana]QJR80945.1 hypothetical protein CA267_009220 [Alteromonas pelagimontana]